MNVLSLIWHLVGFAAPAFFVGLGVAVAARMFFGSGSRRRSLGWQIGVNFAAGLAALVIGLMVSGHDGRMTTYAAMVLMIATVQWLSGLQKAQ